ncbi:MAG: hypothetical protein L0Z50_36765 [Verrucomicrobiales bacterium]|nr:hypothetical protein [Verrucomicrobiales bacterium]
MKVFAARRFVALSLALFVAGPTATAQVWTKKSWTDWSKSDCQKILSDSPWAADAGLGTTVMQVVSETSAVPGREAAPSITYQVRFLSARPVREAMMRLQQLDPKYSALPPDQKQKFEAQAKQFIEGDFTDRVVIQVNYGANTQSYDQVLIRAWQSQSADVIKNFTYLNPGKITPLAVQVGQAGSKELQFIFPRKAASGESLIKPDAKEISLEFASPGIGTLAPDRIFIRFSVKKMVVNGQLIY